MNKITRNRMTRSLPLLLAVAILAAAPADLTDAWDVDRSHTEITFKVNHFFTPVSGTFRDFEIDLVYDEVDVTKSSLDVRIDVASVDTRNTQRDEHLLSGDFFEADAHPYITFRSRSVRRVSETELVATGPLTIKGISRDIELPITVLGVQDIPRDMQAMLGGVQRVAGFSADTRIRRQDSGVGVGSWAATLVVGGNVDIEIAVEANQS